MVLFIIIVVTWTNMPVLDGFIRPVVGEVVFTRIEEDGPTHILVWGRSEKYRDCNFDGLEWRIGDQENWVRVHHSFIEGSKIRPEGGFDFGPWRIQATMDDLNQSFAYVTHHCYDVPFAWKVKTLWFTKAVIGDG